MEEFIKIKMLLAVNLYSNLFSKIYKINSKSSPINRELFVNYVIFPKTFKKLFNIKLQFRCRFRVPVNPMLGNIG